MAAMAAATATAADGTAVAAPVESPSDLAIFDVPVPGVSATARPHAKYQLSGGRWVRTIEWYYNPVGQPEVLVSTEAVVGMLQTAMARWSNVCNVAFAYAGTTDRLSRVNDGANVIAWSTNITSTGLTTWWRSGGQIVDADITFHPGMRSTQSEVAFVGIALHEVGHMLGLNHSDAQDSAMAGPPLTVYNPFEIYQVPAPDDIAGCEALYGAPVSPGAVTPSVTTAVEFYHAGFDHYFVTAYPEEAAKLASGAVAGWSATGESFRVWSGPGTAAGGSLAAVCRFFSASFAPRSGHFYTHLPAECQALARGGTWTLEAGDAFHVLPSPTGACPAGTVPLYRLYNNGMGGAPNHRYTASVATRAAMMAKGWVPEGSGVAGVFACVAQS